MKLTHRLAVVSEQIVTEDGVKAGTILSEDGVVTEILPTLGAPEGCEEVDARGKVVFPGFIDPHVHSRDPGATHKGTFERSTRGALSGGVTTIIEMPNAIPPVDSADALKQRVADHEPNAWVDFALWGLAVGDSNVDQLRGIIDAGAAAVKVFWGYALRKSTRELVYNLADYPESELLQPPQTAGMQRIFRAMAEAGAPIAAHCEDKGVLNGAPAIDPDDPHPYEAFLRSRPAVAESAAISLGAELANDAGAHFHVVHLGSARGVDAVRSARARGFSITAETCPQYLTLTDQDYDRVGPRLKVYPPVRKIEDQKALWGALADGSVMSIGSDHAPHTTEEKNRDFMTAPAGAVGTQTFAPVLTDAFRARSWDATEVAKVVSTNTAKLYGLYPRKGRIAPGADADFTVVDPQARGEVRNEDLVHLHPVSPWDGTKLHGIPTMAVLGGRVAMENGAVVGERHGSWVRARHDASVRGRLV